MNYTKKHPGAAEAVREVSFLRPGTGWRQHPGPFWVHSEWHATQQAAQHLAISCGPFSGQEDAQWLALSWFGPVRWDV